MHSKSDSLPSELPPEGVDWLSYAKSSESLIPSSCPVGLTTSEDALRWALVVSEARNQAILDTAVTAIITISEKGIIESVNQATERMFGYSRSEMVGRNVSMLMPQPYAKMHDKFLENYTTTGVKKIIGIGRETVALRKDGSIFPMDLSVGEVTLPQGRLFTGIIRDISDRKDLEQKILEISEEEQQRIGQDLHDDLCQQLAAIGCLAKVVAKRLKNTNEAEAESMVEIVQLVSQANTRAREMSRGLVPVVLDVDGLMAALQDLAGSIQKIYEVECSFVCPSPVHIKDNAVAIQLYRIAQEGVGNAVKHSQARSIEIHLRRSTTNLSLEIRDDGIGLSENGNTAPVRGTGLGLLTMVHRAKMLGGELHINPRCPQGTQILCEIPFH